jgi:hypothetical protein
MLGAGIDCAGCGDGWTVHEAPDELGPGPCTIPGCPCRGFRWLDRGDRAARRSGVVGYGRGAGYPDGRPGRR